MSPPPIKRSKGPGTRTRRELGPLMEQQHNKADNHQIPTHYHYVQHRDENTYMSPAGCGVDENKFGENQQRPQRPMPASPMLSRVLRNTENLQSPVKHPSYPGFDMDGIKPLPEVDDRVFLPSGTAITHEATHLSTHDANVVLGLAFPRHMPLALPPEQLLEEDHVQDAAWPCPDLSIKSEETLKIDNTFAPENFSDDKSVVQSHHTDYLTPVVLSLPVAGIEDNPQKQPTNVDDTSPQSDSSPQSEEWRMRQPKKRWLREVQRLEQGKPDAAALPLGEVECQPQQQPAVVVTKTASQTFSPVVSQPKGGETKEKWMGAMALIQLAEVPDEGPQPLNLSTARYTML